MPYTAAEVWCQSISMVPRQGRPKSQWGSGAADRPSFERICRSREEKKERRLHCPFFKRWSFLPAPDGIDPWTSICVERIVTTMPRGLNLLCKFVASSRPTDRLFSSPPSAQPPLEFVRPRVNRDLQEFVTKNYQFFAKVWQIAKMLQDNLLTNFQNASRILPKVRVCRKFGSGCYNSTKSGSGSMRLTHNHFNMIDISFATRKRITEEV